MMELGATNEAASVSSFPPPLPTRTATSESRPPREGTENVQMFFFYTIIITSAVLFMSPMRSVRPTYDITIHLTTRELVLSCPEACPSM